MSADASHVDVASSLGAELLSLPESAGGAEASSDEDGQGGVQQHGGDTGRASSDSSTSSINEVLEINADPEEQSVDPAEQGVCVSEQQNPCCRWQCYSCSHRLLF